MRLSDPMLVPRLMSHCAAPAHQRQHQSAPVSTGNSRQAWWCPGWVRWVQWLCILSYFCWTALRSRARGADAPGSAAWGPWCAGGGLEGGWQDCSCVDPEAHVLSRVCKWVALRLLYLED